MRSLTIGLILGSWIVVPLPSLGFGLPKLLILSCTATAAMFALLWSDAADIGGRLWKESVGKLLIAFFVFVAASALWSRAPITSIVGADPRFEGILTYSMYCAYALLGMSLGLSQQGRNIAFRTLLICNLGVCIYAALQLLGLDPLAQYWGAEIFLGRLFSFLGQPNALGLFLILTIPYLLVGARTKKAYAVLLLNAVVLFASVSRSAILGLAVAIPLGLAWKRGKMKPLTTRQRHMGIILTIILLAVAFHFSAQRFAVPTESGRSISARMVMWHGAGEMIKLWPFGYGLETLGITSPRFIGQEVLAHESLLSRIDRAHSQPLDLMVTIGVIGFALYYIFIFSLLRLLWRQRSEEGSSWFLAGWMSILAASIALLFNFHTIATGVWFWLVVGLSIGPLLRDSSVSILNRIPVTVCLLCSLLLSVVSIRWTTARIDMEKAEQWFSIGNLPQAAEWYSKAVEHFPYDRLMLTQSIETQLMLLQQTLIFDHRESLQDDAQQHIDALDRLTNQEDGMSFLLQAWLAALNGRETAVDYLVLQAAMKQPDSMSTYRIAAHAYRLLGNEERVRQTYESLISILPPEWEDPGSPKGRIIWKENQWLSEVVEYATKSPEVPVQ